jgi:hypothetical protein
LITFAFENGEATGLKEKGQKRKLSKQNKRGKHISGVDKVWAPLCSSLP